jgi:hypothetical protein
LKGNTGRCTVCLAVSADGQKLPPLVVFRGKPGEGCKNRVEIEIESFDFGECYYIVQEKAWIDSRGISIWLDKVYFYFF